MRSKQADLPKLLATRSAQTRVLKQYNVKNTKQTTKTSMLDVKQVMIQVSSRQKDYVTVWSEMLLNRNPYYRETSQPISIVNQMIVFQIMRATTEENLAGNQTN